MSSESTELSVRKPNLEHSSSRFFLSPIFPPWTSYDTVPSLGLFIHKPRVAIPAPSLRGSDEMTRGRTLCKPKHIVKKKKKNVSSHLSRSKMEGNRG